jgi:hypothetical protein
MAGDDGREVGQKRRRDRLAASLRENLKRRKSQQKGRAIENSADRQTVENPAGWRASPAGVDDREA